jgi:hypothetical protein
MKHAFGFERNVLRPLVSPIKAGLGHKRTLVSLHLNLSTF